MNGNNMTRQVELLRRRPVSTGRGPAGRRRGDGGAVVMALGRRGRGAAAGALGREG